MSTMEHTFDRFGRSLAFILITSVSLLVLAACGAKMVRGQSPFVQISALKLNNETVTLDLGVRNVNDVVLDIENIGFALSVRDTELASHDTPMQSSVIANGSETLQFEIAVSPAGRDLLITLQNGETGSLPYSLEGTIQAVEDRRLKFRGEGHLYPVPGRPGQFR